MDFHSMKRKELQALCKKHKIPANLTNLEMANRLASLLKDKDKFFNGRRSCLKALDENGKGNESDVESKRVKKVRFSPENQMIEFQKSEAKVLEIKRRGRQKSVINEVNFVENIGGPELCEGVGYVTRSRGRRLVKEYVAEKKGGKRGVKGDAFGTKLPSTVDNVPSVDVENEEGRVVTRRSWRNMEVVDEKVGKDEDAEKGLKNNRRQRNMKQGNVKCSDDVADREESDVACVEVQEKVLRRSKRNLAKVEDDELSSVGVSNEMIATGGSIKPITMPASEGSNLSGLDIDEGMVEREGSPVGMRTRRSRRNASRHQPVITLRDLVADSNSQGKTKKKRRDPILEDGSVEIDNKTTEMPFRRSSRNANRSEKAAPSIVVGKVAQKEKRKSKKQNEEIEDSFLEDLTSKELLDVNVQPFLTEVAKSAMCPDSDNEGFVDNLKSQRKTCGKSSGRKSHPKVQYTLVGINGELTALESAELKNDDIEIETETSYCQTKVVAQDVNVATEIQKKSAEYHVPDSYSDEAADHFHSGITFLSCSAFAEQEGVKDSSVGGCGFSSEELSVADSCFPIDQSDSKDTKGIQLWVALPAGMQTLSIHASLDHVVEDDGISIEKSQESIEHEGLETICDDEFEKYGNASLIEPCETDRLTSSIRDNAYEADPVKTEDVMTATISGGDKLTKVSELNNNDDRTSPLHLGRTLEPADSSLSIQRNGCQVDNVTEGDRNFDLGELKCTKSAKSDKDKSLEENFDTSHKCYKSNIPELSRSVISSMLENGNVHGGEDSDEPAGKHLVSTSIAAKALETTRTRIESSAGISGLGSTTTPLEFNSTLEDPEFRAVSGTTVKNGHSPFQDTNVQEQEKNVDEMNLEKHLELRKQSPSMQRNVVGSADVAEEEKYFEDVKSSVEQPKSEEEDNNLDKFRQSNAFDPSRCKLGMLGYLDAKVGKDIVDDADSQTLVLAAQDFIAQTTKGSKKCYENEPEEYGKPDSVESSVREKYISAKKKNNYEEDPTNSDISMATMTSRTGNIPDIPTGNYIEEPTTSSMKLDTTLEQKDQLPILQMYGYEADNVAEEDRGHYQVELNYSELAQSVEDRQFEEQYHFLFRESRFSNPSRSAWGMLQDEIVNGGEDSTKGQKNTADSKESYDDEPEIDGIADFIESCEKEECISAKKDDNYEEDPVNSEVSVAAMTSGTGNIPYIPTGNYIEEPTTSAMKLDTTLEQKEQSPILLMYCSEADNVAEEDRGQYQGELNSNDLAQSVEDRHFEEQYPSPNMFWESSVSDPSSSTRRMLQDEFANGGEASTEGKKNTAGSKKSYDDETKKDGIADFIESCAREKCISAKKDSNYVEDPVNSEVSLATMTSRTGNIAYISIGNFTEEPTTSAMKLDPTLEKQSPILQIYCSEADNVAEEDRGHYQVELNSNELDQSVENRHFEEQYHSPNMSQESIVYDPSQSARRMPQGEIANGGEDSAKGQKNTASSKKLHEDEPKNDGDAGFVESCMREECMPAKNDDNHEENPVDSEAALATMKCRTGSSPHVSVLHNTKESTSSMNLDITLEQREQLQIVHRNGYEADSVAEVDMKYDLVELKNNELPKSVEHTPLEEQYHSPNKHWESSISDCSKISARSKLQDEIVNGGEDSVKHQKNTTGSRKSYEDGHRGFTDACMTKKCISAKNNGNSEEAPVISENPMEAVIAGTGDFAHISLADNNDHTASKSSDMALKQRQQSPTLQTNGCDADSAAEDTGHDRVELYCDELAESLEDRCLEERSHSPDKCLESSVSDSSRRSASRMLQDEIVRGGEDSIKHQKKSYEDAPEEDGNAGSVKSCVTVKYTTAKNSEDNPVNSKEAMEAIIAQTHNIADIHVADEEYNSTVNTEITLEQREQSPIMQKNGCETDNVAEEDGYFEHKELNYDELAKSVEDRSFEEQYHSTDKCWEQSVSYPSRRMLQDEIVNGDEDSSQSADLLGTYIVSASLAAKTAERNSSGIDLNASISNIRSTDALDLNPTLDGPEFKEAFNNVGKIAHSPFPDKIERKQEEIADAVEQSSIVQRNSVGADNVAEACKNFEKVNRVELANFEEEDNDVNDAEDFVDVAESQRVVFAAQSCASCIIEASDTSTEGVHSPLADNDAQQQGDKTLAEERKKEDGDGISENISDFECTELSETKFTLNFQEKFSCIDVEDNAKDERENLDASVSQLIRSEERIVEDIQGSVALKLCKHQEILEGSDIADIINEHIYSESTGNLSSTMDDTSDTLNIDVMTEVAKPEAEKAEETIDTTGGKFELSVEGDDQEKGEATELAETALGSAWISERKTATVQRKKADVEADMRENSSPGKQFKSETRKKNIRNILIHGTPKKLKMIAGMKENVPSSKIEKIGCLTTVKPATKRSALRDLQK